MTKFVIERQYLLPVYQRLLIEAPSLEDAFEAAIGNDYNWDDAEEDGGRRATDYYHRGEDRTGGS